MTVLMGLVLTDLCGYRNLESRRRKHSPQPVENTRKCIAIPEKK